MQILLRTTQHGALTGFRYFWGKNVQGFDPTQHCAKCLQGPYLTAVGRKMAVNTSLHIVARPKELFYFCGVSAPFSMANNFHLAVVCDGSGIVEKTTYNGYTLVVEGAKELPILPGSAAALGVPQTFLSCRNFQFGAQYLAQA